MIIIKDISETTEGTWFDFHFRGNIAKFKIRPFSSEVYERIRKKYKKKTKQVDPNSRAMVNAEVFDEDAITDELIDYLLESFEGFGSGDGKALEVNLKNKKRIANIPTVEDHEISVSEFIFSKARELATSIEEDEAEQEKNS